MALYSDRKNFSLWRGYALLALLTLLLNLGATLLVIAYYPKGGGDYAFKYYLLKNLYIYIGLLFIAITAFKQYKISLFIGIALLYFIVKDFYTVFILSTAALNGIIGFLLCAGAILGLIMEFVCLLLIFKMIKPWLMRKFKL